MDKDWHHVWNNSKVRHDMLRELMLLKRRGHASQAPKADTTPRTYTSTDWLGDLKNRVFTLFQFAFVAPLVIVQTHPEFIADRNIFEDSEKKAKFHSWQVIW
ncbi:uncharacterized protein LOC62_08G009856 [Vanrija pseudolonga]|uniref:Uncharacterized protein n=1 Tax=Vanrija pseudolonga TaxID=143232 RepID=A0AAF0YLJ9_9TREE|nr:hypothetical protein LOC62_08G009856 [Vanrija pseudolonga]